MSGPLFECQRWWGRRWEIDDNPGIALTSLPWFLHTTLVRGSFGALAMNLGTTPDVREYVYNISAITSGDIISCHMEVISDLSSRS